MVCFYLNNTSNITPPSVSKSVSKEYLCEELWLINLDKYGAAEKN